MAQPEDTVESSEPQEAPQEETAVQGESAETEQQEVVEAESEPASEETTEQTAEAEPTAQQEQDPELEELAQAMTKFGERQEIEQVLRSTAGKKLAKSLKEAQKLIGRKAELPREVQQDLHILGELKQALGAFPEAAEVLKATLQKFRSGQRSDDPDPDKLEADGLRLIEAGRQKEGNRLIARAELLRTPEYREIREAKRRLKEQEEAALVDVERRAAENVKRQMHELESAHGRIDESLATAMTDVLRAMTPTERERASLRTVRVIALEQLGRLDEIGRKVTATPPQKPQGGRPPSKGQARPAQRAPAKNEKGPVSDAELAALSRSLGGNRG